MPLVGALDTERLYKLQTQALQALKRSKGMDGIVRADAEGDYFLVWQNVVAAPKDGGQSLQGWLAAWQCCLLCALPRPSSAPWLCQHRLCYRAHKRKQETDR